MDKTVSLEEYRNSAAMPDMTVLDGGRRPAPPIPLEMFGPFWSEWIVQQADCLSVPPDFVAYPFLASAASLIGNTRRAFAWGKWYEPPIIWAAIVGNPSSRKSPAVDVSRDLLSVIEAGLAEGFSETLRQWETEKQTAEVSKKRWKEDVEEALRQGRPAPEMPDSAVDPEKPARPRIMVGDTTPEALAHLLLANKRGLLCWRDELSGWLESFGRYNKGGDRALWIEAFGGRPYVVDRVGRPEPLSIERMSISLTGGLQPDRVASLLMSGDDDGLCSRFLLTMPDPLRPKRPQSSVDGREALEAFQRLQGLEMGVNDEGKPVPVTMPLCAPAADILEQWQKASYDQDGDALGLYGSHLGKLNGYVLRLALVSELLRWAAGVEPTPPQEISADVVGAVCDFMDSYAKPMALRIYGDATLPPAERGAAQIARRIRKEGHRMVNLRTVRRDWRLPGLKETNDVKAAVDVLCEAGWLTPAGTREGGTKGRHSADYRVNPLVFEDCDG
ncbi:MAG: DUF3987 domain-containing protein [Kiloniellaceae bacterium]